MSSQPPRKECIAVCLLITATWEELYINNHYWCSTASTTLHHHYYIILHCTCTCTVSLSSSHHTCTVSSISLAPTVGGVVHYNVIILSLNYALHNITQHNLTHWSASFWNKGANYDLIIDLKEINNDKFSLKSAKYNINSKYLKSEHFSVSFLLEIMSKDLLLSTESYFADHWPNLTQLHVD